MLSADTLQALVTQPMRMLVVFMVHFPCVSPTSFYEACQL